MAIDAWQAVIVMSGKGAIDAWEGVRGHGKRRNRGERGWDPRTMAVVERIWASVQASNTCRGLTQNYKGSKGNALERL